MGIALWAGCRETPPEPPALEHSIVAQERQQIREAEQDRGVLALGERRFALWRALLQPPGRGGR